MLCVERRIYMAIEIIISFRCMRFLLVVTLINFFQLVVAAAAEASSSGGLVDIGGRKIYLECRGTGSPTVVLISGTRGAHDDWTDLIDPKNPNSAPKPGEPAVFPQVSKFTRVCPTTGPEPRLVRSLAAATRCRSRLQRRMRLPICMLC